MKAVSTDLHSVVSMGTYWGSNSEKMSVAPTVDRKADDLDSTKEQSLVATKVDMTVEWKEKN